MVKLGQKPFLCILRAIVDRLSFHCLKIGCLYLLELDHPPHIPRTMLRGPGKVRAGSLDDLNQLAMCGASKYHQFLKRFRSGDHCVVAQVGADIIGYEWFSIRPCHIAEPFKYRITVPHDCVYAYDAFILPEYRGSGVWLRFKSHLSALMEELGRRRVLTYVEQGNELSLASHFRLGFKPVKLVFVSNIWA